MRPGSRGEIGTIWGERVNRTVIIAMNHSLSKFTHLPYDTKWLLVSLSCFNRGRETGKGTVWIVGINHDWNLKLTNVWRSAILVYDFMKTESWYWSDTQLVRYGGLRLKLRQGATAGIAYSVQDCGLRLCDRISVPGRHFYIRHRIQTSWTPSNLFLWALSVGLKRLKREADHSPLSSAKVKTALNCKSS